MRSRLLLGVMALVTTFMLSTTTSESAASPSIDSSSCGLNGSPWAGANSYCSFVDGGSDVVIGPKSCNTPNSCLGLANGVRINPFGFPWTAGSCNGDEACRYSGQNSVLVEILGESCNGAAACFAAGQSSGWFWAGNRACNGDEACYGGAQNGGSFKAASESCNGEDACKAAAQTSGDFKAGFHACNGVDACKFTGQSGLSFKAGAHSCNGDVACVGPSTGDVTIGVVSCNQSGTYSAECTGAGAGAGDCMYNESVTTAQEVTCLFVDTPGFQNLQGILQSVLSIFAGP